MAPPTLRAGRRSSSASCWPPLSARCQVGCSSAQAARALAGLTLPTASLLLRCCCCACCQGLHHMRPSPGPPRLHPPVPPAEGSAAELTSAAPAADGSLVVTMAASLPRGSSTAAEEAQYMAAVLQNDAKQARCRRCARLHPCGQNGRWQLLAARQCAAEEASAVPPFCATDPSLLPGPAPHCLRSSRRRSLAR